MWSTLAVRSILLPPLLPHLAVIISFSRIAMIVAIAFDVKSGFETLESCQKWLAASPYAYMLKFRSFHLRRKRCDRWMCGEKRPVYSWTGDLWRYKGLAISRPEPGIVIVECGSGSGIFNPSDFPVILPETAEKNKEKEQREKERKQQRDEKRKTKKGQDKGKFSTPKIPRKRKLFDEVKVKEEPKSHPIPEKDFPGMSVATTAQMYADGTQPFNHDSILLSPVDANPF